MNVLGFVGYVAIAFVVILGLIWLFGAFTFGPLSKRWRENYKDKQGKGK